MKAAAVLALTVVLLTGCAPAADVKITTVDGPSASATPTPMGTVMPIQASAWDAAQYPDRPRRDDFIYKVATQYAVWSPGKSWRVSGDGWESGEEITLVLRRATGPAGAGAPMKVRADEFGQFVAAFNVPANIPPGDNYSIIATGKMGFSENQQVTVVAG